MDKRGMYNVYNFVGAFSDISVNDSLISSNALQHKSSISSFPFKCEEEQETDKKGKEINGIGGSSVEVHDFRIQSDNWCLCSVTEEVKVTNCYSEREYVIKQENPGNDSEQDPLFINEDDLSRKIILERIDSKSPFFSKIKKEEPDVLAASSVNGNEKERSLAKETSFPSTKEQSRDLVNILEKKVNESAHNVDSTTLISKDVINPLFSKNECQGKSLEQSIVCGNCQRTKHYSQVTFTLEAQNNNVNKKCECRSNDKGNHKKEVKPYTGVKRFKCSYCEYRCSHKGHLKYHILTHTGEKPFKCAYCEYRCSQKGSLNTHILTHTGVKPFKCSYCEYRCITKGHLKRHILTHAGVKPFKCSYCEYRCSQKGHLKNHILTHTGMKPFKCSYCEYRCSQKGHLKNHILTHTGAKSFKCAYCEYRCSHKGDLKKHILTHMGVKPFKCSYCEYRCSQKGNLKTHILTHTAVKPFQCSYCDYTCTQKHSLSKHVKKHSGVKL